MALMCGAGGGPPIDPEIAKINAEAQAAIAKEEAMEAKVIKMLLLGAGESGKSTIFKQMKIINKNGYTTKEKMEFVGIVHSNTVQSMETLMTAFVKLGIERPADLQASYDTFSALKESEKLNPEIATVIRTMWDHEATKMVFGRKNEYQLNDSADYYFNDVERIATAEYEPTEQDVLRSRVRTTGIVQSDFVIKGMKFAMFDVGGQRNERRKWIHAFDNVNAVVFVAALPEYDQVLFEDESMNRMDEAITLFEQIVNSKWFRETAIILFLNKRDLFETKLQKRPLKQYYAPASKDDGLIDDTDPKQCGEFFKRAFTKKNKNPDKSVFTHVTCATDTTNVKFVFSAVIALILEENLKALSML